MAKESAWSNPTALSMSDQQEKNFKKEQVGQVNPPKYEKAEDMSNLTYLNDASVLYNLKQRYYHKLIYVSSVVPTVWHVCSCNE